jgi:hypothetical protein
MLTFVSEPAYELAMSGGTLFTYFAYVAYITDCPQRIVYHSLSLALSSIWFHSTKSAPAFWTDQVVLNTWVLSCLYDAYTRDWMAVGVSVVCIMYAILMFYVGQMKNTYAYHPSRFWSIFFHISVHMAATMCAIINVTMFSLPK